MPETLLEHNVGLRQIVRCCRDDGDVFRIIERVDPSDGETIVYIVWQYEGDSAQPHRMWFTYATSSFLTWSTVEYSRVPGRWYGEFDGKRYYAPRRPHV